MPTEAQADILGELAAGGEIHLLHGYHLVSADRVRRLNKTPSVRVLLRRNWIAYSHTEYTTQVFALTDEGALALERYQNTQ